MKQYWEIHPPDAEIRPLRGELFAAPRWAALLAGTYGFDYHWLTDGEGRAYPLAVLDDEAGKRVSLFPFSDYIPLEPAARPGLMRALTDTLTARFPDHLLQLKLAFPDRSVPELPPGWQLSRTAVGHRWGRTDAPPRATFGQKVRQAHRKGVYVRRRSCAEAAATFYRLYAQQRMERFGLLSQPPSYLNALHRHYMTQDAGFYLEAVHQDAVIAAFVVLRCDDAYFHKYSATAAAARQLRPNNLLYHQLQEDIRAGRAALLDFGLSGTGDNYRGLRDFKSATGAGMFPVQYWTHVPEGYPMDQRRAFLELPKTLTQTLVAHRAPLPLREAVSERIYPFFA